MKPFYFKQFKIYQDKTAMKVGTDGVLLGAWTNTNNTNKILDIGTGTGLIALMMAQKNSNANIYAIENEKNAYLQAKENIQISKWENRIHVINTSLQNYKFHEKFDLIVSNPPFFNNSFKVENKLRNQARHSETLNFETLLECTSKLLSKNGSACFILPYSEKNNFIKIIKKNSLYPNKILLIKGNVNTKIKRILISISFKETKIDEDILSIEISRHHYTLKYVELVKDFYYNM